MIGIISGTGLAGFTHYEFPRFISCFALQNIRFVELFLNIVKHLNSFNSAKTQSLQTLSIVLYYQTIHKKSYFSNSVCWPEHPT